MVTENIDIQNENMEFVFVEQRKITIMASKIHFRTEWNQKISKLVSLSGPTTEVERSQKNGNRSP